MTLPDPELALITSWENAWAAPCLASNELHLWLIDADKAPPQGLQVRLLPTAEQPHTGQRRSDLHQIRYLITQCALRSILANYLDTEPKALIITRGPQGKPYLRDQDVSVKFNLTTSNDLALLAVTKDQEIGIDCEHVRPRSHMEDIAAKMFPPHEYRLLKALPADKQLLRFYQGWTRLEAQVKATGLGLYHDRNRSYAMAPYIQGFIPAPDFVATLAAARPLPLPRKWRTLRWSPSIAG